MTTREIERASAEDEKLFEIRKCWRTGDRSTAPSPYKLLRDEITVIGRLSNGRYADRCAVESA